MPTGVLYQSPKGGASGPEASVGVRTAPFSIIRLDGPDRDRIEEGTKGVWNKIVEPKDDGLRVDIIRQNVEAGLDTYGNVNSHYEEGRC